MIDRIKKIDFYSRQLEDENQDNQENAVLEISRISVNNPELVDRLIVLLDKHKYSPIREMLIYSLGQTKSQKAVEFLINMLTNPDYNIRYIAAEALRNIDLSDNAIKALIDCLTREEVIEVKSTIIRTLSNFETKATILTLHKYATSDKNKWVRRDAINSLQKLVLASNKIRDEFSIIERFQAGVQWYQEGINKLGEEIGYLFVDARLDLEKSLEPKDIEFRHKELKLPLIIASKSYELNISPVNIKANEWRFELRNAQSVGKIPSGFKLKLLDEKGLDFERNKTEAKGLGEEEIFIEVQLEPKEGLIWEIEPIPENYHRHVIYF